MSKLPLFKTKMEEENSKLRQWLSAVQEQIEQLNGELIDSRNLLSVLGKQIDKLEKRNEELKK
jgi:septal ring factor EnvC (AmiA/AmiB activator)